MSRARDLADGTFSGAFEVDSPTLVVDAANNRVGVGTSSPANALSVNSGAATTTAQFTSTGSSAFLGLTNSGSTAFVGAESSGAFVVQTSGSAYATKMNIDAAGRVTMPYQPMFSAFNLATGSQYPITYSTWATFDSNLTNFSSPRYAAETNIGSHYSTSNGRFTAPVAGRYLISINVSMWVGNTSYLVLFTNGAYSSPYQLVYNADLGAYQSMTLVRVMTLAASDYVEPGFYASSGTYATFIPGGGYLQFSGYLIG